MRALTIGKLAADAGVPVSTVRYYERRGLLEPAARTSARYRVYGEEAIERLRFIKAAQRAGFRLDDVAELLGLGDGRGGRRRVQKLIEERLVDLDAELRELQRLRDALRTLLGRCRAGTAAGRCRVIAGFVEAATRTDGRRLEKGP